MKNLLVAGAVKYAANSTGTTETALNPMDLMEGALGFYGLHLDTERLITQSAATAAGRVIASAFANKQIRLAVGKPGSPDTSLSIDVSGIKKITGAIYTGNYAFAKSTLTITPASTPNTKNEYNLRIGYRDISTQQYERETYSVQGSFANATALVTALKAEIDADANSLFGATLAGATLVLTSKRKSINVFQVGYDGDFASFGEVNVSAQNESLGDPYFLKQLEKEYLANKGTADQITSYMPKLDNQVDASLNYSVYAIEFKNDAFPKGSQKEHFDVEGILYVALPVVGALAVGDARLVFETILVTLLGDASKFTRITTNP